MEVFEAKVGLRQQYNEVVLLVGLQTDKGGKQENKAALLDH